MTWKQGFAKSFSLTLHLWNQSFGSLSSKTIWLGWTTFSFKILTRIVFQQRKHGHPSMIVKDFPHNNFFFLKAAPVAYGGSQARGWIGAVAASLHHSHSNAGSLIHWAKVRDQTRVLMDTNQVHYCWAMMGTPHNSIYLRNKDGDTDVVSIWHLISIVFHKVYLHTLSKQLNFPFISQYMYPWSEIWLIQFWLLQMVYYHQSSF